MRMILLFLAIAAACASAESVCGDEKTATPVINDAVRMQLQKNYFHSGSGGALVLFERIGRKRLLINPVVVMQDRNGNPEWIYRAKQAELLFDTRRQRAYLHLKDCDGQSADGGTDAFFLQKVFEMELPAPRIRDGMAP